MPQNMIDLFVTPILGEEKKMSRILMTARHITSEYRKAVTDKAEKERKERKTKRSGKKEQEEKKKTREKLKKNKHEKSVTQKVKQRQLNPPKLDEEEKGGGSGHDD